MVASCLVCPRCQSRQGLGVRDFRCACGSLYDIEWSPHPVSKRLLDKRRGDLELPGRSGVWRYRELVHPELSSDAMVSLGEGNTPLIESRALAQWVGLDRIHVKHEGCNPTGSFKDRGMSVAVSHARSLGAERLVCASTGNTSSSLAAYAAAAGLQAVVIAPEKGTALGKLSQALAYGAKTLLVRGDFDQGLALVLDTQEELGLYLVNSVNPFRLEGQKSIVFELLQDLRWHTPDWIVLPAGALGNTSAFGKALRESKGHGLIERVPRIAAVQASGANPFSQSYRQGFKRLKPVSAETVASAIRIGNPASWKRAARSIRETDGIVCDVPDAEIIRAKLQIDRCGIGAEPGSAAAVAGAKHLVDEGVIQRGERVVCVLTGHLLKDPGAVMDAHIDVDGASEGRNPPWVIEPDKDAVRAALEQESPPAGSTLAKDQRDA